MNKVKIFVDMDGVLVNFQSGIDKLDEATKREYANDPSTGSGQVGKPHYDDVPGIFSLMDPMPGAIEGVRALKAMGYDLYILSTAPWGNPSAWSDKVKWITKHLDDVFHKKMVITHCKGLLAAQEGAYLIDDRTGHGASDFGKRHIQFGTERFPDWASVVDFFRNLQAPDIREQLDAFCRQHGFLYHERGAGHFGASPYWTFYRVGQDDKVLFSIEYICQTAQLIVRSPMGKYEGRVAGMEDFQHLLSAMQIDF